MFGIADREKYDAPIIFVNANTIPNVIINNNDNNGNQPTTRIFSNCWNTYSTSEFNQAGYIHHKINGSDRGPSIQIILKVFVVKSKG